MHLKLHISIHIICFTLFFGHSQTTTNFNPSKDNSIYSESNNSNGLGQLYSGSTQSAGDRRALLKFDVSSIPSNATVNSVTLTLNVNLVPSGAGTQTYTIHPINKDWGEGTSLASGAGGQGGTAVAPDATWTDAMLGTSTWTNPGGDFGTVASSVAMTSTGNYTFPSESNFVTTVQNWVNTPSSNFGLILIGDESGLRNARRFGSKDIGTAPILTVNWTNSLSNKTFKLEDFSFSPNPTSSYLKLDMPLHNEKLDISIYTILGKKTFILAPNGANIIDVSHLKPGIYILNISNGITSATRRFVKI